MGVVGELSVKFGERNKGKAVFWIGKIRVRISYKREDWQTATASKIERLDFVMETGAFVSGCEVGMAESRRAVERSKEGVWETLVGETLLAGYVLHEIFMFAGHWRRGARCRACPDGWKL